MPYLLMFKHLIMSQKFIQIAFLLLLGSTLWMSNNAGYATIQFGTGTFAPNEISCQVCHTAGSPNTIQTATVIDLIDTVTNKSVTSYQAGRIYKVKVTVNKVSGTPAAHGFQMVSLLDKGDVDVKGWTNPQAGVKIVTVPNGLQRQYVEHTQKKVANFFETKWKSPAANSGSVTFYACGNGVNSNGQNTGDGASIATLKVKEASVSTNELLTISDLAIYPTIVTDQANYSMEVEKAGNYTLRLISLDGKVVQSNSLQLNSGLNQGAIELGGASKGIYLLHLTDGLASRAIKVIKE